MKLRHILITAFIFLHSFSFAQHLTGTWEGSVNGDYCKIVLFQVNDSLFGYTYDTGMGYCKANFKGTYNDSTQKLKGKGIDFIEKTLLHSLCVYNLNYSKQDDNEFLKGRVAAKTIGTKILSFGIPMMVTYRKISDNIDTSKLIAEKIDFYKQNKETVTEKNRINLQAIPLKDTAVIKQVDSVINLKTIKESRTSKLFQTITTNADSIKLVLYDNGAIDGDTVTVFDNGKIIINQLALSLQPYEIVIPVNKDNSFHVIELMANNLGSIPPNTAFMLILAGKERYELRLTSDFSVNAQINIQYKNTDK
jgi:hypothetical protein